jgi:hypothetical protein
MEHTISRKKLVIDDIEGYNIACTHAVEPGELLPFSIDGGLEMPGLYGPRANALICGSTIGVARARLTAHRAHLRSDRRDRLQRITNRDPLERDPYVGEWRSVIAPACPDCPCESRGECVIWVFGMLRQDHTDIETGSRIFDLRDDLKMRGNTTGSRELLGPYRELSAMRAWRKRQLERKILRVELRRGLRQREAFSPQEC